MIFFRPLPWEYGIRNLMRRPLRTALTLVALTTVTLMVMVVLGFVRGLDRSLMTGGHPQTAIVFSLGMGENLEYSSVPMQTADLLAASIPGIRQRYGTKYASPELYLGTKVKSTAENKDEMGLVRGVTPAALLVHGNVEMTNGSWPNVNEVLIGRMAATKLGLSAKQTQPGRTLHFEGRTWTISGTFAAAGSTYESEIWCRLDDLQQAMKRQDLSLVALKLDSTDGFKQVNLFCKERLDLELQAICQSDYFATLQEDYRPVRLLSWLVVMLVSGAGIFIGLNTMYGAVVGRIPELAMLQTIGFSRRAAVLSIMQEGTVLAMTAALLASIIAYGLIDQAAVRFTMGAFELQIDATTLLIGYAIALFLGIVGSLPPAIRLFRLSVVDGLRAV